MRAIYLVFQASFFLTASVARAEVHAACCYCEKWFTLSEKGFGFARHHVGLCGECTKQLGDIDAAIKKLQGQNRGLADAARLTLDRLEEALARRDKARDSIFGPKGSAVDFFKSLMKFSAEGTAGKWKNVAEYVSKGVDYYSKAADALKGDFKWVWKDGVGWVKEKVIDKAALKTSARIGREYYAQTRDARGATNRFLERHKQIKKSISFLDGAKSLYDDGNKLADGIQDYLEAKKDSERLEKEWDEITKQMDELLKKLAKLKHCRDGMNKQKQEQDPGKPGAFRGGASGPVIAVIGLLQVKAADEDGVGVATQEKRSEIKARMRDENQPNARDLELMQERLKKIQEQLTQLMKLFEDDVYPPLAPFWLEVNDEMGPELSLELLKWAKPNVERAAKMSAEIWGLGRYISDHLGRTPQSVMVGSSRGYTLHDGPEAQELVLMQASPVKLKKPDEKAKQMSLNLKDVDEEKRQALLRVGNSKDSIAIGEGETRRLDLNGDGREDVEVSVKQLSEWNSALVDVKKL